MDEKTEVDRMYDEATALIQVLERQAEVSLQIIAADNFRKSLILAVASYFEHHVCECVLGFVRERASGSDLIENFVRNKAIARQYHTWFEWDGRNANKFFSLFGDTFKSTMSMRVRDSEQMREAIRAFLEIGNERNRLVHQNFATFPMDKTLDEIYSLYRNAKVFVEVLPDALRSSDSSLSAT